jgi:ABC-type nitrate/sulfonate/bicarbonate transport system substrate-binding protein
MSRAVKAAASCHAGHDPAIAPPDSKNKSIFRHPYSQPQSFSTLVQRIVILETTMTHNSESIKRARGAHMLTAVIVLALTFLTCAASGQSLPKIRMAYTSIAIQFTPVYLMKELDLPRKQGLDVEILMIPVSSRAVQSALAGELQFMTSGGVANINANMAGADFVGVTSTINTLVYKILGQPSVKEPGQLKGKKIAISRIGGVSDFSARFGLDRWGLVPDKDVALIQVGGDPEALLALQNKVVDAAALSEPFATMAQREGYSLIADLSRLNIPFTHHGIGTRKLTIHDRRDIVVRFLRSYLEGIYVFKTNRELSLKTLQKVARLSDLSVMQSIYDEYSQRLTPAVPYPTPAGIQTIIDQIAKTRPQAKGLNPNDFIDPSILKEIEDSGFVKRLYGK